MGPRQKHPQLPSVAVIALAYLTSFPGSAQSPLTFKEFPATEFCREWVARSEFWRHYVFQLLGERLAAVLARLEETSFERVDLRLARLLLASGDEWTGTHQRLAVEIGTAREVISRILERWQSAGWIETKRGCVKILNRAALQAQNAHS